MVFYRNIGDYFNTDGFIQFNDANEFKNSVLPKLTEETYKEMLPFIKENFDLCLEYVDFWDRIQSTIRNELKGK